VTKTSRIIGSMDEMDQVFRALAAPTRRKLLDELFRRDGQTLSELERKLPMSRYGVMKHLAVLEEANLVVARRRGREKLHFLNPVPIRLVYERWVNKYAEPFASALSEIKRELEEEEHGQVSRDRSHAASR
jgi:DNA-binding transcriptional ArsR family regulator